MTNPTNFRSLKIEGFVWYNMVCEELGLRELLKKNFIEAEKMVADVLWNDLSDEIKFEICDILRDSMIIKEADW